MVVCFYGSSRDQVDKKYKEEVYALGKAIAEHGHSLVYGGGGGGLMGACSKGVIDNNGLVIGVAPHFMAEIEKVTSEGTTLIWTGTMGERKDLMENNADAFVIAPGGIGTFDEFFQVLVLKQLDRIDKPIILFNIDGYYDKILEAIEEAVKRKFVKRSIYKKFNVCKTVDEIMKIIG